MGYPYHCTEVTILCIQFPNADIAYTYLTSTVAGKNGSSLTIVYLEVSLSQSNIACQICPAEWQ